MIQSKILLIIYSLTVFVNLSAQTDSINFNGAIFVIDKQKHVSIEGKIEHEYENSLITKKIITWIETYKNEFNFSHIEKIYEADNQKIRLVGSEKYVEKDLV